MNRLATISIFLGLSFGFISMVVGVFALFASDGPGDGTVTAGAGFGAIVGGVFLLLVTLGVRYLGILVHNLPTQTHNSPPHDSPPLPVRGAALWGSKHND